MSRPTLCLLALGLAATPALAQSSPLDTESLAAAARAAAPRIEQSLAGPQAPVVETRWSFPQLDVQVTETRTVLPDGRVARTALDDLGAPVDVDTLRAAEHAAGHAARGKLAPTLRASVDAAAPEHLLGVAFWLTEPGGPELGAVLRARTRGLTGPAAAAATREARQELLALARDRYAPGNAAVAAAVEAGGGQLMHVAGAWPLVIASLPAGAVDGLAAHPLVDEAYLAMPHWAEEGDFAQGTLRTPNVWDLGVLADGSVNIMVNDTAQVQAGNAFLPTVVELNSSGVGSHATGVAGNIANTHPTYHASCYTQPQIFTAGGTGDVTAPIIWEDAIAQGIDVGNCSWWNFLKGSIEFLDRFFDHAIRNFGVMMFKSNGNQGTSSTPYGTTPGQGYNMTSSGAYDDQDTLSWDGDQMASSSSYWDPIEGHMKPEIASPGTCVTTAGTGGSGLQTCFGGTSSASPLTCGVASLMASGDNTLLAQMTTLKALLMATAWHNVEGAPLASDKDGAGGVHAAAAWQAVANGQWWYEEVVDADFSADVLDVPVELLAGERVRVCALWFSNPDDAFGTDVLDMDLDMTVLSPGGAVLASSASATNPFELVSVDTVESGVHTVRLTRQRFDGVSEPLSVVWSRRNDSGTATVGLAPFSDPFAAGMAPTLRFEERYVGAGRGYIGFGSLLGPPGVGLGVGYGWPTGVDTVFYITLGLPGFVGTLDAAGQATAALPLPGNPALIGQDLHFSVLVLDAGGTRLETLAPTTTFTIL